MAATKTKDTCSTSDVGAQESSQSQTYLEPERVRVTLNLAACMTTEETNNAASKAIKCNSNFDDTFTVVRTISAAIYGRVVLARHNEKGVLRAVKIMEKSLANEHVTAEGIIVPESVCDELRVGRTIRTFTPLPLNLLPLAPEDEQSENANTIYLVMPYVPGGSLYNRIQCDGPLLGSELSRLIVDLAQGLAHLHREVKVAHMDISLENILCLENGSYSICDYGLVRPIGAPFPTTRVGKRGYMSPELFDDKKRRHVASSSQSANAVNEFEMQRGKDLVACDIFSFGVVLFTAAFGVPPHYFPCEELDACFQYIQAVDEGKGVSDMVARWDISHECTVPMQAMIQWMLTKDPEERPSLAEVLTFVDILG